MPSLEEYSFTGKRLLVTGASGFVGQYVLASCVDGDFRGVSVQPMPHFDIRDRQLVGEWVGKQHPDYVIHLAAQSFVPRSFDDPAGTIETNLIGTLNLLQALDKQDFSGRFLYVSSGDVYGAVPDEELPVSERRTPAPRNPYAVSKIAAEQLCLQWHRSNRLDVVIARPFNHVGPGQGRTFVIPAMAAQVAAIAAGKQEPVISVGDIDVTRDFTDVRDVVSAYARLLVSGVSGRTYLIGSGVERSVRDILSQLLRLRGVNAEIVRDASKFRPAEQRRMVADCRLTEIETGWVPRIQWDQTLKDILEELEKQV